MSIGSVIIAIVAILAFTVMQIVRYNTGYVSRRGRNRQAKDHSPRQTAREVELQREVEDLRERVKVLERIATDDRKRIGLADEIEQLRGER